MKWVKTAWTDSNIYSPECIFCYILYAQAITWWSWEDCQREPHGAGLVSPQKLLLVVASVVQMYELTAARSHMNSLDVRKLMAKVLIITCHYVFAIFGLKSLICLSFFEGINKTLPVHTHSQFSNYFYNFFFFCCCCCSFVSIHCRMDIKFLHVWKMVHFDFVWR